MMRLLMAALGLLFGWTLSRAGAADYNFIQQMFLLQSFQLYGIIGTAVILGLIGFAILERYGRTATGEPIQFAQKPLHRGTIVGSALFGIGWSMTGMCPGPIIVNIGEGKLYALAAFAGAWLGAWVFGLLRPRLREPMGLP
ncbi:MAG: transporter [Candidatus Dadabacteria bacterium]|nr:MAG: transporter [Candidatus Dadabacteria bacterium]